MIYNRQLIMKDVEHRRLLMRPSMSSVGSWSVERPPPREEARLFTTGGRMTHTQYTGLKMPRLLVDVWKKNFTDPKVGKCFVFN